MTDTRTPHPNAPAVLPELEGLTYLELLAMRDQLGGTRQARDEAAAAGLPPMLEVIRAMHRNHRAASDRSHACEAGRRAAVRYQEAASRWAARQRRYSTEVLEADAAGERGEVEARYALELLRLGTVAERLAAWAGARRFLNATPDAGRPSDALRSTVNSMLAGHAA
jgi:hypothetical protein